MPMDHPSTYGPPQQAGSLRRGGARSPPRSFVEFRRVDVEAINRDKRQIRIERQVEFKRKRRQRAGVLASLSVIVSLIIQSNLHHLLPSRFYHTAPYPTGLQP